MNANAIEHEAERRRLAWNSHYSFINSAAEASDSVTDFSALSEHLEWSPPPTLAGLRERIEGLADELTRYANEAWQVVREGGASDLDDATGPNAKGQPRSIELASLFDEARSLSEGLRIGMAETRVILDDDARRLRALGDRVEEIKGELWAVLNIPAAPRRPPREPNEVGIDKHERLPSKRERCILKALSDASEPLVQADIAARAGYVRSAISAAMPEMEAANWVRRPTQRGGYALTDIGRKLLPEQ